MIARAKAIKLLSASEFRLYEASRRGRVGDHGAARLRKLLEAAKKGHAKQTTIAAKQRMAPGTTRANQGTELKREVFSDIIARLERASARSDVQQRSERAGPPAKARKPQGDAARSAADVRRPAASGERTASKRKRTAKKPERKKREAPNSVTAKADREKKKASMRAHDELAPRGAARRSKGQIASDRAHLAHSAARGRRTQAKRDARR